MFNSIDELLANEDKIKSFSEEEMNACPISVVDEIRNRKAKTFEDIKNMYGLNNINTCSVIRVDGETIEGKCFLFGNRSERLIIEVEEKRSMFTNCTFCEDVHVILQKANPSVEFNRCVFLKRLFVYAYTDAKRASVVVSSCFINKVMFKDMDDIEISNSVVYWLQHLTTPYKKYFLYRNVIHHLYFWEKVDENNIIRFVGNEFKGKFADEKKRKDISEEELIKLFIKDKPGDQDDRYGGKIGEARTKYYYYDALVRNSDNVWNKKAYADALYHKKFYAASDPLSRFVIWVTRGFCKPILFLVYLACIVLLSGIFYYNYGIYAGEARTLLHSLYISVLTSLTIQCEGVDHIEKCIAVMQVIVSVLFSGCFLTAIINKYID